MQCINILIYVKFSTIKPLGYYNITNRAPTYQQEDVNLRLVFPPMHCYLRSLDSSVDIRLISNLPMNEYSQRWTCEFNFNRNKAKYELKKSYWIKQAQSMTHMWEHKSTLGRWWQIFKLKDNVKIHTTRKLAQQGPKSNCGFDKSSELFNKFLTTVSSSPNGLQTTYTRQVTSSPGLF